MNTVLVAGFYDPVKKGIDRLYSQELKNGTIVWIEQAGVHKPAKLDDLSRQIHRCGESGHSSVLILLAVPRGSKWISDPVRNMVKSVTERNCKTSFQIVESGNLAGPEPILEHIASFIASNSNVSVLGNKLRRKIGKGRVLCMSMNGRTNIRDALARSGFDCAFGETFYEEKIEGSRNSNLMNSIAAQASSCAILLYAWDGLRTLTPDVKEKFSKCYEAQTASKVVQLFLAWIEDELTP